MAVILDDPKGSAPGTAREDGPGSPATDAERVTFVLFLLLVFLALLAVIFAFWPPSDGNPAAWDTAVRLFGFNFVRVGPEVRSFVLVVTAGALGSFIHVANSSSDYIANRQLKSSWIYWYILRLPVGASLALLSYLLLRGGVLTGAPISTQGGSPPYGIVGLAGLAGMFSKNAASKLGEIFDQIFKTDKDALRDKLTGKPTLLRLDPPYVAAGAEASERTLRLLGTLFVRPAQVLVAGKARDAEFVNDHELRIVLTDDDVRSPREIEIGLYGAKPAEIIKLPVVAKSSTPASTTN